MIRNSSRISRPACLLAALVLSAGLTGAAQAQTAPDTIVHVSFRHALRLDVGGILARNFAYNALNSTPQVLLPILVGYEQQLGRRSSGSVEVLLNGGEPNERLSGVALQGRYYFYQRHQTGLAGFYLAPTLSYRAARQSSYYSFTTERRKLGGAGALLGAQVPLGGRGRLLLDVSGGIMAWKRLDGSGVAPASGQYDDKTYYERNTPVFDGRISLGYRF